jgi:GDPmannose 4,6-dehydratase
MKLKKKPNILIVGTGVLGAYLSKSLLYKKYNIIVTSRKLKKNYENYEKLKISKKIIFIKLNLEKKKEIEKIINKYQPIQIYYLAGQSSIFKSIKLSRSTIASNYTGAKNFLEIIYKNKLSTKFFKANSGYIFSNNNKKINLKSKLKKPNNPYVFAQIKAYKLIKNFRKIGVSCYSLIFFNIESILRPNDFFIKKICYAVKNNKKIDVGNTNNIRDFAWAPEIMKGVSYLYKIKPCDMIFASGTGMSGREIIEYIYKLKKLNYKNYIKINFNLFRKDQNQYIVSSMSNTLKKLKKFNWKPKIYGKRLLKKMYQNK